MGKLSLRKAKMLIQMMRVMTLGLETWNASSRSQPAQPILFPGQTLPSTAGAGRLVIDPPERVVRAPHPFPHSGWDPWEAPKGQRGRLREGHVSTQEHPPVSPAIKGTEKQEGSWPFTQMHTRKANRQAPDRSLGYSQMYLEGRLVASQVLRKSP